MDKVTEIHLRSCNKQNVNQGENYSAKYLLMFQEKQWKTRGQIRQDLWKILKSNFQK